MKLIVTGGAGFIGSEVSASARAAGGRVTVLEALEEPMERVLGKELGAVTAAVHRYHGVDLRTGTGMESIEETSQGVVVRATTGEAFEGDAVVVGIGMQPNVEIARVSEITVGNGIRVDEFCRTSLEGVFAAGDVANHYHPIFDRRMRVEHFDNATRHGTAAARNMLGIRTPYVDAHWFWSDQYELTLQVAGLADGSERIVCRDLDDQAFILFHLDPGGRLVAASGIGPGNAVARDIRLAEMLIARSAKPSETELASPNVRLKALLAA